MKTQRLVALFALMVLAIGATVARADSGLWLHVKVNDGDEKVTVNLPLSLVEKAIPMIPSEHFDNGEFVLDGHFGNGHHLSLSELRDLWNELKSTPDMTFVTVESDDETVKVSKSGGYLRVHADEDDDRVEVKIPEAVVDALLSGSGESLDIRAAITALASAGEGELVTVNGDDEHVRVWIDSSSNTD